MPQIAVMVLDRAKCKFVCVFFCFFCSVFENFVKFEKKKTIKNLIVPCFWGLKLNKSKTELNIEISE